MPKAFPGKATEWKKVDIINITVWVAGDADHDPRLHLSEPWPSDEWSCVLADSVCEDCYNEQGEDNPCRKAACDLGLQELAKVYVSWGPEKK